jgi:GTP-binding protein Era
MFLCKPKHAFNMTPGSTPPENASDQQVETPHRAGFVNIIGSPNVGKSTLMNQLVGERLSIINRKAQTTRHRIMGIVSGENWQIVYSDTPGVLTPAYKLQEGMMRFVRSALSDADLLLVVTDHEEETIANLETLEKIQRMDTPVILLVNKVDLSEQEKVEARIAHWKALIPRADVHPVSALHGFNVEPLMDLIVSKLPESPAYFPKDELTDKPMRFFVSEIIRDKILTHCKQEVPYSAEVVVESYKPDVTKDGRPLRRILAVIYVARDSQKRIVIGKGATMIRRISTDARRDIEAFIDEKVFMEVFVKVDANWRDDERKLKSMGYLD